MDVTINSIRQNEFDQTIFFTFDDDITEYQWSRDLPLGVDAQTFLDAHIDITLRDIRHKEYPGCPNFSSLAEMEAWITDGHKITTYPLDEDGQPIESQPIYQVIDKVPWTSTHPEIFPATEDEMVNLLAAAKDLVENLAYGRIATHVENTFGDRLNEAQLSSLTKLYKVVLYLAKKE